MKEYDCIVFGGPIHAGGIDGISLIKKNLDKLKGKRLIVFATGLTPPNETAQNEVRNKNLTPQQQADVELFYLRGGFNFAALPSLDRILMTFFKKHIMRKQSQGKQLTEDETGMLEMFDKESDFTAKDNIQEILQAARR